jgi:hypothetical protein
MRPVRIPSSPQIAIVRAVCSVLVVAALGCGGGQSGPTGIIDGGALGKFCHELNRGGQPVVLTMQLGDPAIITITARTSVCAPMAGTPCATIPVGLVPLKILDADKLLLSRSVVLTAGKEYVFQPKITNNLQVALTGGELGTGVCQGLDFPVPDGGYKDAGEGGVAPGDGGAGDGAMNPGIPEAGAEASPADAGVDVAVPPDAAPDAPAPADGPEDAGAGSDAAVD